MALFSKPEYKIDDFVTNSYFEVSIQSIPPVVFGACGKFTKISGIGAEFEYETYNEGGQNFPRYYFKNVKTQRLVLEQGTVSSYDGFALAMNLVNLGSDLPFIIYITLKDPQGKSKRSWNIVGAHLVRYEGPVLDANQSELAVSRIEFLYNGAF